MSCLLRTLQISHTMGVASCFLHATAYTPSFLLKSSHRHPRGRPTSLIGGERPGQANLQVERLKKNEKIYYTYSKRVVNGLLTL